MTISQQLPGLSFEAVAASEPTPQPMWYAVQTRGRHEKKVCYQLKDKGMDVFLPCIKEVHRWSDRKKVVEIPLFPSYAFVHMVPNAERRLSVLQTDGVVRLVSTGPQLLPIEQKQIEDIRVLVGAGVPMMMYPFLKLGQRIRVRGGCLDGLEGIFVSRPRESTLIITVDAIQRSIAINVDGYQVEPI